VSTMKKEATCSSQIMVTTCKTTRHHNPAYKDPLLSINFSASARTFLLFVIIHPTIQ
jgi:hypothetical protein